MQVLTKEGGEVVPNLYCIGDANGKLMLAHAASAHGVRYDSTGCQDKVHIYRFVEKRVYLCHYLS